MLKCLCADFSLCWQESYLFVKQRAIILKLILLVPKHMRMLSYIESHYDLKNETMESLLQANHTMTRSIISHNESEKIAENYIRIQTSLQNQRK